MKKLNKTEALDFIQNYQGDKLILKVIKGRLKDSALVSDSTVQEINDVLDPLTVVEEAKTESYDLRVSDRKAANLTQWIAAFFCGVSLFGMYFEKPFATEKLGSWGEGILMGGVSPVALAMGVLEGNNRFGLYALCVLFAPIVSVFFMGSGNQKIGWYGFMILVCDILFVSQITYGGVHPSVMIGAIVAPLLVGMFAAFAIGQMMIESIRNFLKN